MDYLKGLLKKKLEKWNHKKWYHQRFDGAPYFLHYIAEAEINTHKERKKGGNFTVHYCFFHNDKADWYIAMEDIEKVYTSILQQGKKNPKISKDFMDQWKHDEKAFYQICAEIEKKDIKKLSDQKLIQFHNTFMEITLKRNSSSSLIDGFALGTDELIAEEIKKVYEQSTIKTSMRFTELFSALTAPIHLSFINDAEVALLELAIQVQKKPEKKKQLITQHQKKYFWIHNNYVADNILSADYFEKEIENIFKTKIEIPKEIKKIKNIPKENKKRKQELIKQLELSNELKLLITISEDFTSWQDERKKATFWTTHYFSILLQEIGKRTRIPLEEIKYLSPREVNMIFQQKPERKMLQERRKNSVFFWDEQGHEAMIGQDVEEIRKAILGEMNFSDLNDFRGLTACLGMARGPVKVVKSAQDIDKVKKGDILVAVMTRPDYVPAMKIAAAIVTDEGGITCHAAIVARELGIPCIIGTKIATKILQDGMQVEVNANHGWVRIHKE